jgi:ATP-dependent 26S proteasome regulatory subunit
MKLKQLVYVVAFAAVLLVDVGSGFARIQPPSSSATQTRGASIWKLHVGAPPTRLDRLTESLDKYILTGAPATRKMALDILQEIEECAAGEEKDDHNEEELTIARRRMQRAGFNADPRHKIAEQRKQWEESRKTSSSSSPKGVNSIAATKPPSDDASSSPARVELLANSKKALQDELAVGSNIMDAAAAVSTTSSESTTTATVITDAATAAELVSELVAQAGANLGNASVMGIGGLDDVLNEVKRRVWIPLAAPPRLLKELGIRPIRGLLLYGKPGAFRACVSWAVGVFGSYCLLHPVC